MARWAPLSLARWAPLSLARWASLSLARWAPLQLARWASLSLARWAPLRLARWASLSLARRAPLRFGEVGAAPVGEVGAAWARLQVSSGYGGHLVGVGGAALGQEDVGQRRRPRPTVTGSTRMPAASYYVL